MRECDLHTIVRLPQGVFAPYTQIPANLLFFEKTGPTKETWFYEILPPEGRKGYTKTKPIRDEEFDECIAWWGGQKREKREESEHAWRVSIADINEGGFNLDLINPSAGGDLAHQQPQEVVGNLIAIEREILSLLEELSTELRESK
jgi:type I restriction enzyme M protein